MDGFGFDLVRIIAYSSRIEGWHRDGGCAHDRIRRYGRGNHLQPGLAVAAAEQHQPSIAMGGGPIRRPS
jgi:hypothetical protein